jgi:hypothetical protein
LYGGLFVGVFIYLMSFSIPPLRTLTLCLRGGFVEILSLFSYGRAYSFAPRGSHFVMPLLGALQEVAKKRAKTFPLGTPLTSRRFTTNGGFFVSQKSSICGAYIPPRRWVCFSKIFLLTA